MSAQSEIKIVDNVFVKMFLLENAGDQITGHAHTFDHITLLAKGTVTMSANDEDKTHVAPKLIVTPKGVIHQFKALTPGCVLCCVHAIRDGDDETDVAPPDITEEQAKIFMEQFPLTQE
jgi:quercetin dioxygenase-like cupin family protein